MTLILIAYVGGVLTILSPCILPVLPFVFARAGRPFVTSTLPMMAGLALMFAGVATLAAIGGGWAVQANQWGRWIALILLAGFGLMMLFPAVGDRVMAPLQALGSRLTERVQPGRSDALNEVGGSLVLGLATGLLWAPCAGPILGLILTGAALNGASASTSLLLLAYALGAATSMALALLVGGRVLKAMKGYLKHERVVRRVLGALVLVGVASIALGLDRGVLARVSAASTERFEQGLLGAGGMGHTEPEAESSDFRDFGPAPEIEGVTEWLQGDPATLESLRGKVVLIDFWTYSCINCLRTLPHVIEWDRLYRDHGLVVIGMHAPEFAFERDPDNVRRAVDDLGIDYRVALDNDFAVWRAYQNRFWPAHYFIDARGRLRHVRFGEGEYERSEAIIRTLLMEAGATNLPPPAGGSEAEGVMAADSGAERSPETYLGTDRGVNLQPSAEGLAFDQWALQGDWTREGQRAVLTGDAGAIVYRFRGRDVHLVLASTTGRPVRYRITLNGQPPGEAGGSDISPSGEGVIGDQRLYQLLRLPTAGEGEIRIEFLDPGAAAYAFTFG
jgi:cytochrome c biogenesis protein CcdA/thiol-disulfide isomerase/thioredoxin